MAQAAEDEDLEDKIAYCESRLPGYFDQVTNVCEVIFFGDEKGVVHFGQSPSSEKFIRFDGYDLKLGETACTLFVGEKAVAMNQSKYFELINDLSDRIITFIDKREMVIIKLEDPTASGLHPHSPGLPSR